MSVATIIQSLQKLIHIHASLVDVSEQKTSIIKEGLIDKLQPILSKERQAVQMLEKAEAKRQQAVEQWYMDNQLTSSTMTITHMLDVLDSSEERHQLEEATTELTHLLTELKRQEQLNNALIQQSMQFIQMSLDMMQPTIKNVNYGDQNNHQSKRSVFDSKA